MNNNNTQRYHAFISYRHTDNKTQGRQWATWLHQAIETYEVPAELVGKTNHHGEKIPAYIHPVFRDEEELPANADLAQAITDALDSTHQLIVLCSPNAVASQYVAQEIDYFKQQGRSAYITSVIIDGEPGASWDKNKQQNGFEPEDECFAVPLQFEYDANGQATNKRIETLAADFRVVKGDGDRKAQQGWTSPEAYRQHLKATSTLDTKAIQSRVNSYQQQSHLMVLKVIAGILGVPLGELTQRDKAYQLKLEQQKAKRLRRWFGAISVLAIIAIGTSILAYIQKDRAQNILEETKETLVFMNYNLRDVLEKYVPTSEQLNILQNVDLLVGTQQTYSNDHADTKRERASAWLNKAEILLNSEQTDASLALPLLLEAHSLFKTLAQQNPEIMVYQQDMAVSHSKLADLYQRLGQTNNAFTAYQASLLIREKLAAQESDSIEVKQGLIASHNNLGEIYQQLGQTDNALASFKKSTAIVEKLLIQDPQNPRLKRSLAILNNHLGDTYLNLGQTKQALTAYQTAQSAIQKLSAQDPNNLVFQRDMLMLQSNLGDNYLQLGLTDLALDAYHSLINLNKKLVKQDPTNTTYQSDLSVSQGQLGNTYLRQGQIDKALGAYQTSQSIAEKLVNQDPPNTRFQRILCSSHDNLGYLYLKQSKTAASQTAYKASLTIRQKLAKQDPINTQFQQDLSISHSRLVDIYLQLGQTDNAQTAHQASLAINKKLVKQDPENTRFKRSLCLAHSKSGDIYRQRKQTDHALAAYQSALTIGQELTYQHPASAEFQRLLSMSHTKLAETYLNNLRNNNSKNSYQAILEKMSGLAPSAKRLTAIKQRKAMADNALAAQHASLIIDEELAVKDPKNSHAQRYLAGAYMQTFEIYTELKQYDTALTYLEKGHDQLVKMDKNHQLPPDDKNRIKMAENAVIRFKAIAAK